MSKAKSFWQLGKYGVIGVLSTIVQTGVFYTLASTCLKCLKYDDVAVKHFDLPVALVSDSTRAWRFAAATAIGFIIANIFCWLMNRKYVFTPGKFKLWVEFSLFFFSAAFATVVAIGVSGALINYLGLMTSLAVAIEVLVSFFINFFARKFFIFYGSILVFAFIPLCAQTVVEQSQAVDPAVVAQNPAVVAAPQPVAAVAQSQIQPLLPQLETLVPSVRTKVFHLSHVSAQDLADRFNNTWAAGIGDLGRIYRIAMSYPEANAVAVTATEDIIRECENVIREVDKETPQVYIEARFIELGNTASHKVGIDWSMLDGMRGTANFGGGIDGRHVGKGIYNYQHTKSSSTESTVTQIAGSQGANGSVTHFTGTLDFSEMSLTLRALQATEDARIFSNPKIIVSSGKKATVDMTTKYPNVFISSKRTTSNGVNSMDLDMQMAAIPGEDKFMFAREAFFSWGISLEVLPRIGTNGIINVSIVPTISSQKDWVQAANYSKDTANGTISAKYPVIDVQRLITEFDMASGTTAVIGGLSRTEEQQVDNGIPGLKSIPYLGEWLFSSKVRQKVQKEILVFVTVGLVDPGNMRKDAGLPKNAVMGRQYTQGKRQEPGDRPNRHAEGLDSLDMRPLEEQVKDPLRQQKELPASLPPGALDTIKVNIAAPEGE